VADAADLGQVKVGYYLSTQALCVGRKDAAASGCLFKPGDRDGPGGKQRREPGDPPGGNPGANGWFLESTPIQMPPRRGGICGRLTQDLPSARLQGGSLRKLPALGGFLGPEADQIPSTLTVCFERLKRG
jgi:hypothetical protein